MLNKLNRSWCMFFNCFLARPENFQRRQVHCLSVAAAPPAAAWLWQNSNDVRQTFRFLNCFFCVYCRLHPAQKRPLILYDETKIVWRRKSWMLTRLWFFFSLSLLLDTQHPNTKMKEEGIKRKNFIIMVFMAWPDPLLLLDSFVPNLLTKFLLKSLWEIVIKTQF